MVKSVKNTRQPRVRRDRQEGAVLFIAMISLVVMILAAIALMRATGTAGTISGNMAFKEAATQAADTGVELAFAAMPNIISTSVESDIANQYFATQQPVDSKGMPTTIDWTKVACHDNSGNPSNATISCSDKSSYRVQYVIDRQCTGTLPIVNIVNQCVVQSLQADGSHKAGGVNFTGATKVFYRVTVRVLGPRDTSSLVQASLSF